MRGLGQSASSRQKRVSHVANHIHVNVQEDEVSTVNSKNEHSLIAPIVLWNPRAAAILADAARHIARALHPEDAKKEGAALLKILRGLNEELRAPSSALDGGFV